MRRMDRSSSRNVNVSGTDGDAIRVRDFGSLTVRNSSFSSIDADGMDIEDGERLRVINTDARNNEDEGLEVDDVGSVLVVGGEFTDNGDDGIDIDNSQRFAWLVFYRLAIKATDCKWKPAAKTIPIWMSSPA